SAFDGWQGCDSTNGSECTVTLTSDTTVTASFCVAGTETVDWGGADASGDGGGQAGSVPAEDDWRFAPSSTGLLETRGFLTLEEAQAAGLVTGVPPGGMQVFGRLFAFTLIGGETGGTAVVTIDYGQPIPAGAQYWKYFEDGELFGPPEGAGWYRFDGAVIDHAAGTVTLTLTDGEFGDADWVANAVIRDPGGLFTQAEPVPTLSQWAMLLLVMLLGAVGTNAVGQVALSRNLTYGHDG
ncbi:MAG: IPTL-CTERM sorting domain-containing protein, partial [Chromatiales bacterium]|nr:IPTL-CTERM sorting domain-containing protein [Chromatiales bacterium]